VQAAALRRQGATTDRVAYSSPTPSSARCPRGSMFVSFTWKHEELPSAMSILLPCRSRYKAGLLSYPTVLTPAAYFCMQSHSFLLTSFWSPVSRRTRAHTTMDWSDVPWTKLDQENRTAHPYRGPSQAWSALLQSD
jgi:hypothetical protein